MKVQITLQVPNGISIEGGTDIQSGSGGLVTSTFVVAPGEVRGISADIYGSGSGEKQVQSSITYFPVGHQDRARQQDTGTLEFEVESTSNDEQRRTEDTANTAAPPQNERTGESDRDNDGVPDSADYAPDDPDVQAKSDLEDDDDPLSASGPGFTGSGAILASAAACLLLMRRG